MPSVIAHSSVAFALGSLLPRPALPRWAYALGAVCAALPDLDVISFRLGISYAHMWGHRGFTHSIAFALASALTLVAIGALVRRGRCSGPTLFIFLFACTLSHGLLDAMTDGGHGVAFFVPFSTSRYFLPWRPIAVAPLGMSRFFSARGLQVLGSEAMWVVVPSLLVTLAAVIVRAAQNRSAIERS